MDDTELGTQKLIHGLFNIYNIMQNFTIRDIEIDFPFRCFFGQNIL